MKSTAIKLLQALLLVLTVPAAGLLAQSEKLEFTTEEQAWINANPIIKVGGGTDWAPFDFADAEGRHTGIVADYLDLLSARTGLQFEVRLDSFTNLMSALDSGDIDLLPAVYFNEERARRNTLTSKYYQVRHYVFARDDVDVDRTLSGKTVAMVKGFSSVIATLKEAYPDVIVLELESVDATIDAVVTRRADYLFDAMAALNYRLNQNMVTNIHPVFAIPGSEPTALYMTSREGAAELASIISKVLDSMGEAERQAIVLKWVGMGPAASPPAGPTLNLTPEEIAWIAEHPTIRVHNEMDWPPFNFNRDGVPQGFSVDFMNLVAARAGLQLEYVSGPSWNEFVEMIRSEELDVIINMTPTPDRQSFIQFTTTYAESPAAVMTSTTAPPIQSMDDLRGKKVAVAEGFYHQEFLERNYPEVELVLEADVLGALYAVLEGRADAMFSSLPSTQSLMDKQSLTGLRIAHITREAGSASKLALGIRHDWPILRDILQKAMDTLSDEQIAPLRHKWLALAQPTDQAETDLELTAEQLAWIAENPTIRVHNEMDWPPFNFNENGQPRGFSVDLMDLIAADTGLIIEYISGPVWDEFKEMLAVGDLDVLLNVDTSPPAPDYAIFTTNYATMATAIFVSDQDLKIESLEDLADLRITVTRGFSTQRFLEREYPETELLLVDTLQEAVFAVMDGRADAVVDDFPAINYIIEQNTLTGLHVAMMSRDPDLIANLAIGVRKDWPILKEILQKALDNLDPDAVNDLRSQWLGQRTLRPDDRGGLSSTIYWLVGITLGVFLLLIVLNRISSHFFKGEGIGLQTGTQRFRFLMLGGLSIFVALVGILGWLALNQIKEKILQDVGNNLENVLLTTTQRLDIWVNQQVEVLDQIVKNADLIRQIELLLMVPVDAESLLPSAELSAVRANLEQYQDALELGFFIINPDGISIGSRRDNNIGTNNLIAIHQPARLERVFLGEAVFVPPMRSDVAIDNENQTLSTSLFIAVPVRGDGGEVIAALTMRLDPKQDFSRLLQFSRVGESGESYAFDRNGTLLSASRFEDDLREIGLLDSEQSSVMNIQIRDPGGNMTEGFHSDIPRAEQPFTHMAGSAIANIGVTAPATGELHATVQSGEEGYRDYRGVPVFGAWLWDESLGLGLTSEIDVSEAFSTFNTIRTLSIAVLGVTLFLSLGGTLFILTTGERTNRVLRKAKDELEDRVEERTRDLNASKEQYSSLVGNIPGAVYRFLFDAKFTTILCNDYYAEMTGYPAEDFMSGKVNFSDLIHPDDQQFIGEDLSQCVAARKPFDQEFRIINNAGNTRWLRSRGMAVYDSDGNPEHADGTMFDITDKKQAEFALHEAKKTADAALDELENVSSVILRWLPDATISSMNTYGMNLFGYSEEELIGKSLFGTIVRDIKETHAGVQDLVKNIVAEPERFLSQEGQNCNSKGVNVWMSWANNPILNEDGSLKEILAIGHDITKRKTLEAELETAMNVANAATKAKGDFLANMSHEIRTPMNAIMGLSDLCRRTELNPKQQDYLDKIYGSAESLLGIINDILDFSKIEAGKLSIEAIDFEIDQVLKNLATVSNVKTQEKGLELLFMRDPQVPSVLVGDPLRLGQILINLTNNAVKFTDKGEIVVDIELRGKVEDKVTLEVAVRDTGIGMTPEQQARECGQCSYQGQG